MKTIMELGMTGNQKYRQQEEKTEPIWLQSNAKERKRIHLAGLGDVGRNVALGLTLLGGEEVEHIGLYDLNEAQCKRMEIELSQVAPPPGGRRIPSVSALAWEDIFSCEVFLFCATKSVPALGSEGKDVQEGILLSRVTQVLQIVTLGLSIMLKFKV